MVSHRRMLAILAGFPFVAGCSLPDGSEQVADLRLAPHAKSGPSALRTLEVIRDGLLRAVENVEHFLQGRPRDVVVAPIR